MVEPVKQEVKPEPKKETAADIVAREKAKHKVDTARRCHFTCKRCHVIHNAKLTESGLEQIGKNQIHATGRTLKYGDSELVEILCLRCGSCFWIVNPMGKPCEALKAMSVIWD